MAESKRTFRTPGINRDLDDRLLPDGMYRDGLNVNVGRSEGDDVGALENLKGNEVISTEGVDLEGTTIGTVRDPNNDRIYWMNTSDRFDSIYEFDESTGEITTILSEPKTREAELPTCAPDILSRITNPDGNRGTRATLQPLPPPPVGGCTDRTAINFDANATFDDGSCIAAVRGCTDRAATNYNPNANVDDGSCTFAPTTNLEVTVSGGGLFQVGSGDRTLTANASNVLGTASYSWSTGETTQSITVNDDSARTVTATVTVTDDGRTTGNTASASGTITFQNAPPPPTFTLTVTTTDTIANATSMGSSTQTNLLAGASISAVSSGIAADSGFEFPGGFTGTATLSGDTTGFTLTQNGETASLTGTMPAADVTLTITWGGDTAQAIPQANLTWTTVRAGSDRFTFTVRDLNAADPGNLLNGMGTVSISGGSTTVFGFDVNYNGSVVFADGGAGGGGTHLYTFDIEYASLGYSPRTTAAVFRGANMTLPNFGVSSGGNNYNVSGGTSSIT